MSVLGRTEVGEGDVAGEGAVEVCGGVWEGVLCTETGGPTVEVPFGVLVRVCCLVSPWGGLDTTALLTGAS